jgi:hypothetical protein
VTGEAEGDAAGDPEDAIGRNVYGLARRKIKPGGTARTPGVCSRAGQREYLLTINRQCDQLKTRAKFIVFLLSNVETFLVNLSQQIDTTFILFGVLVVFRFQRQ